MGTAEATVVQGADMAAIAALAAPAAPAAHSTSLPALQRGPSYSTVKCMGITFAVTPARASRGVDQEAGLGIRAIMARGRGPEVELTRNDDVPQALFGPELAGQIE